MTPEQFAYWLQGFVELNGGKEPTAAQWKSIKEHLGEVFHKVTPPLDHGRPSIKPALPPRIQITKRQTEGIIKEMQRQPIGWPVTTLIC